MASTAEDFKKSAVGLVASAAEIDRRNAISRTYYAAFHIARDVADQLGLEDKYANNKMGDHERLIKRFEHAQEQPYGKKMAVVLADMRRRRGKADYEIDQDISGFDASTQFKMLERFEAQVIVPISSGEQANGQN